MSSFQIYFYLSPGSKHNPVKDFIDSLDKRTKGKLQFVFELLQEYGTNLGFPYTKKIKGTSLWELRIISKRSVRIFYVKYLDESFIILHGFIKKSQQIQTREIKLALHRFREIVN